MPCRLDFGVYGSHLARWEKRSQSIRVFIQEASQHLFSADFAFRISEDFDIEVAIGKELDLPAFARYRELDLESFWTDS